MSGTTGVTGNTLETEPALVKPETGPKKAKQPPEPVLVKPENDPEKAKQQLDDLSKTKGQATIATLGDAQMYAGYDLKNKFWSKMPKCLWEFEPIPVDDSTKLGNALMTLRKLESDPQNESNDSCHILKDFDPFKCKTAVTDPEKHGKGVCVSYGMDKESKKYVSTCGKEIDGLCALKGKCADLDTKKTNNLLAQTYCLDRVVPELQDLKDDSKEMCAAVCPVVKKK